MTRLRPTLYVEKLVADLDHGFTRDNARLTRTITGRAMTPADWIALCAAAAAVASAIVAIVQASSARDAADAAKAQAEIMRQQLDHDIAVQHEEAGPVFVISNPLLISTSFDEPYADFRVEMTSGLPLKRVLLTVTGEDLRGGFIPKKPYDHDDYWAGKRSTDWTDVSPGISRQFFVTIAHEHGDLSLTLRLECQGEAGGTWTRVYSFEPRRPPPTPPLLGHRRFGR